MWITPKTDWTADDNYNYTDLNRVESNTDVICDLLAQFDEILSLITKSDRTMSNIEYWSSLERVDGNIRQLAERHTPNNWIDHPLNKPINNNDANRWEINLLELYKYYNGNLGLRPYCGMITCGEDVI